MVHRSMTAIRRFKSPIGTRGIVASLLSLTLALASLGAFPATAHATVAGTDIVATTSASSRGLTIMELPDVVAKYGILVDADGNVLWARFPDDKVPEASITKMMTASVVLDAIASGQISLDTQVTISTNAAATTGSVVGLTAGTTVTVNDLLQGLLVHSGNDCAVALAEEVAGSESAFYGLMNTKASEIGMTESSFASVNGLDTDNHYSSAHDLEILARYAMHYDTFRSIVTMQSCTITLNGIATTFDNTNTLLGSYDGIEGIKTGSTDNAGYCLASACKRNGIELYCIVLGCETDTDRFTDTETLLDWGYTHYTTTTLATAGTIVAYDPITSWIDKTVSATIPSDVSVPVLDYDGPIDQQIVLKELSGTVRQGDVIGTITWLQGETTIASTTLVAGEDVQTPNALEAVGIWFQRLKLSFDKTAALTESVSTILPPVTISTPDAAANLL